MMYAGFQAFVVAEFAASLEWQIFLYFRGEITFFYEEILILFLVYGFIYIGMWRGLHIYCATDRALGITWKELFITFLITIVVFAMSNLSFLKIETPFSSYGDTIGLIRTIMDFAGVAMLYAYHVQRQEIRMRRDFDAMQNIFRNQYQQYQQSKESINLINRKYHDLKHQIAVLRMEDDPEKRNAFLNRMEEEIHQYEIENKTGNKVVDTILASKNALCKKFKISFNYVVDGSLLDFMDVMDICSILGNALDNAIECEQKIEGDEKRLIYMAVFSQKNFVILRFENYFEGELIIQEGTPVTTKKKEAGYHGYGIKSIQHVVNKYGGAVSFGKVDNWFELKILIPREMSMEETEKL